MTKLWAVLLIAVMTMSFAAACGTKQPTGENVSTEADTTTVESTGETTQITILGTTDLRGNIWGFGYADNYRTCRGSCACSKR